ncbi:MAG: cell division protein [Alphaproteobacteria bacterium]|nr:cell division protein [Alphaproteobacteria bacterium]MDE2041648.1 cell division protein [Alphaproteobacteria bacterium]MDE2340569.1 cell division protein [Alphaproteobacteria bacterium]
MSDNEPVLANSPVASVLIAQGGLSASAWIFAILTFITVLAAAVGLALATLALSVSADASRKLTVQIVDANPDIRHADTQAAAQALRGIEGVRDVQVVDDATLNRLMAPWLGQDATSADLPYPSLIDVTLGSGAAAKMPQIEAALAHIAPSARTQANADWLAPVLSTMKAFAFIAMIVVLALVTAIVAAVILATRAGFTTHRNTIDILHLMGATDQQIAALFQRRIAKEALLAAMIGTGLALLILAALMLVARTMASEFLDAGALRWWAWLALIAIPLLTTAIAHMTARRTVLSRLAQIL